MNKVIPLSVVEAFAEIAQGRPFHITPVRICDNCQDESKEAFPYNIDDANGIHFDHLCNDCYDAIIGAHDDDYPFCSICGGPMEWEDCWNGCDDGYFDMYDEDPLWYDEGDLEMCEICKGMGGYWLCPNAKNHQTAEGQGEGATDALTQSD